MYTDNGAPANGVALAMNIYTTAPGGGGVTGYMLTMENHIGVGTGGARGMMMAATGPVLSGDAMLTYGNWANGWNAYGHNAVNVSAIAFAQPFPLGGTFGSLVPTDYVVDGSQSDTFRLARRRLGGWLHSLWGQNRGQSKRAFPLPHRPGHVDRSRLC
jgi:hypothetical protein